MARLANKVVSRTKCEVSLLRLEPCLTYTFGRSLFLGAQTTPCRP